MSLVKLDEIKHEVKETLTKTEKEQLVEYVQHILQEEMLREMGVFPGGKAELGAPCLDDRELVSVGQALNKLKKDFPNAF